MSHVYTPGLKVKAFTDISKTRKLPVPGDVLVKEGDFVESNRIIARTLVSGEPHLINVALGLGVEERDLEYYMLKKQGDSVQEGEIIAARKSFFGLFKSFYKSPVSGRIEFISTATGQVSIREPPETVEIDAYIPGEITKVIPNIGAVIKTSAAFVQGILGIGGEKHGKIKTIGSRDESLRVDMVTPECSGKILVGGAYVDSAALVKAVQIGVMGIVVGGIDMNDLTHFLGYEIGVATTGHEEIGLTLIIIEGFGHINMARKTFELFESFNGWDASINGVTQIRAGVIRPEIIIPLKQKKMKTQNTKRKDTTEGMVPGTQVRIICDPWFGSVGRVVNLPTGYFQIGTGSKVRVLELEFADGNRVTIPRANVEIFEE